MGNRIFTSILAANPQIHKDIRRSKMLLQIAHHMVKLFRKIVVLRLQNSQCQMPKISNRQTKKRGKVKAEAYPKKERDRATILNARYIDLFCGRFLARWVANHHTLEDRRVEHDAQDTVGPHDHTSRLLAPLLFPDVDFERANSALFPFLVGKVEELRFAREKCCLSFLTSFNYNVQGG